MSDRCAFNGCRSSSVVVCWLGRWLCERCWYRICRLTDEEDAQEVRRKYTRAQRSSAGPR